MKTDCLNHPKTQRLQRALGIPRYQAIGILESLWLMTGQYAEDGIIGRYTDEEIASHIGWDREASELIDALAGTDDRSGFLDRVPENQGRLLIHDWEDHMPEFLRARLRKRRQRTQETDNVPGPSRDNNGMSRDSHAYQTKPNPTEPDQTNTKRAKLRFDDSDLATAAWMADLNEKLQVGCTRPKTFNTWANTIRLMREIDGRTDPEIREVYEWCHHHDFWAANVQCPQKLRKHWPKLQTQRMRDGRKRTQTPVAKSGRIRQRDYSRFGASGPTPDPAAEGSGTADAQDV